nr:hypothetical protein [Metabacillus idriensis]
MLNFGRKIKITIGNAQFNNDELEIRFEVPFDDDVKPNQSFVELYNLSNSTISKLKRGQSASIQAGYGGDVGVLCSGKVDRVLTKWENVEKITKVYIIEGDDFTKVKVSVKDADKSSIRYHKDGPFKGQIVEDALSIGFKPGTDGLTIIKRIVNVLGIKLGGPISLPRNKIYKKGYNVTKLILNNLEEVVHDCGAAMYHRRGKLVIRSIKEGTDEKFILSEDTGLIEIPAQFEETDKKGSIDVQVKGYKTKCLLQHRITTASIISVSSSQVKGKFRAKKGVHYNDRDNFLTEFKMI